MKKLIVLVLLAVAGGAGAWHLYSADNRTTSFRTISVERGDLLATISATGTIEPEEVIDVGAQVAGQINTFGKDEAGKLIDYGSQVKEGMILAQIDDALYQMDAAQAQAQLDQAQAGVENAEANLQQMQATFDKAQRDWERAQKAGVGSGGALSQEVYDTYRAAYETSKANVAVG